MPMSRTIHSYISVNSIRSFHLSFFINSSLSINSIRFMNFPLCFTGLIILLLSMGPFAARAQNTTSGPPLDDRHPPAVTGGTPTITDTASLSPPGWLEFDPGSLKSLNRDRILGTPFTLKLTDNNRRLQYRFGTDGYIREGNSADGYGDTYMGIHYLIAAQERVGFDIAGRFTLKLPTSRPALGGTKKFDYYGLLLASRDFTKWGFHGDFNVGLSDLSRPGLPGTDTQLLLAASTTSPIKGGRWQYTNELVYASPILGQHSRFTTMHGFAYAAHRYEVYSLAVQYEMHGDGATVQVLAAGSFYLGKIFK